MSGLVEPTREGWEGEPSGMHSIEASPWIEGRFSPQARSDPHILCSEADHY